MQVYLRSVVVDSVPHLMPILIPAREFYGFIGAVAHSKAANGDQRGAPEVVVFCRRDSPFNWKRGGDITPTRMVQWLVTVLWLLRFSEFSMNMQTLTNKKTEMFHMFLMKNVGSPDLCSTHLAASNQPLQRGVNLSSLQSQLISMSQSFTRSLHYTTHKCLDLYQENVKHYTPRKKDLSFQGSYQYLASADSVSPA